MIPHHNGDSVLAVLSMQEMVGNEKYRASYALHRVWEEPQAHGIVPPCVYRYLCVLLPASGHVRPSYLK